MPLIKENIQYVLTHRDQHFTDQLVTGASEYENLALVGSIPVGRVPCHITSISMIAATRHDFTIAFYSKDVMYQQLDATPFAHALLGMVHLNAEGAWQHGTQYVYATDFPAIQYMDEDNTGELHVGLHNRDSKTKLAAGDNTAASLPDGVGTQFISVRFGFISAV